MERQKISSTALAHEKNRVASYALKHRLMKINEGRGVICMGRNDSYLSYYVIAIKDTKGDKNARRHGFPLGVEVIISILPNGKVSCLPIYARHVTIRNSK